MAEENAFVQQCCSRILDGAARVPAANAGQAPRAAESKPDGKKEKGKKGGKHTEMIETEPVKGTRDFAPVDMRMRNWLFGHFKDVARRYGFSEYDAPILESEELYKRKAGEEITEQMYNFVDKGGRPVALRPEMTPSLARLVLAAGPALLLPIKWFSLPQCWRYEATTRGRRREHYQWNMDIFGEESVSAEAELLAAIVDFFRAVGLTNKDVGIKVSSRKVLQEVLTPMGIVGEGFAKVCVVVDKLGKLTEAEITEDLMKLDLPPGQRIDAARAGQIIASLKLNSLDELERIVGKDSVAVSDLKELFELARAYGYADWLLFDASIVRGLAYYTGVVFEGFDRAGALRAICGGGRYDHLLTTYGAPKDVPACGFGFGDCVIYELLKEKDILPPLPATVDYCVIPLTPKEKPAALMVTSFLRSKGCSVDVILARKKKVGQSYSYADRVGAQKVVLVATDEWARGCVKVKDMKSALGDESKEVEVPWQELESER